MSMSVDGGEAGGPARAVLHPHAGGVGVEADVRARAAGPGAACSAGSSDAAVVLAAPAAPEPPWKSVPVRVGFLPDPARMVAAARGWASSPDGAEAVTAGRSSTARKTTAAKRSTPSPSSPTGGATASELAFLKDKRLSVEDKLFLFMALMEKKSNAELEQAMTDYEAKRDRAIAAQKTKEKEASQPASSGGGGFLGGIVDAVQGVVKQVGGPLLASAATAVGAPFLAPAALSVGGALGADLVGTVADLAGIEHGGSRTSKPRSSPSSSGGSAASATPSSEIGEFDEKYEMAKIDRLVQKQNAMFACLSNVMKAMHDTQMVAVNNIR